MLCTASPAPARPRPAAVIRCQVRPSRDVQITACVPPPAAFPLPAARKPAAVLVITHTESPGSWGDTPWVDASVHDVPSGLVQMACGPIASHPARAAGQQRRLMAERHLDPFTSAAACSGARRQVLPPSDETKNCWRTRPSLVCEPRATIVPPEATTRLRVWKTPRCCWPG